MPQAHVELSTGFQQLGQTRSYAAAPLLVMAAFLVRYAMALRGLTVPTTVQISLSCLNCAA